MGQNCTLKRGKHTVCMGHHWGCQRDGAANTAAPFYSNYLHFCISDHMFATIIMLQLAKLYQYMGARTHGSTNILVKHCEDTLTLLQILRIRGFF